MALTLAWVEREIEECMNGDNTAKNVTDYAILCIARENLKALQAEKTADPKPEEKPQARNAIVLADYCADLNKVPRVEEIGAALDAAAAVAYEQAEKQKIQDLRTWNDILRERPGKKPH